LALNIKSTPLLVLLLRHQRSNFVELKIETDFGNADIEELRRDIPDPGLLDIRAKLINSVKKGDGSQIG